MLVALRRVLKEAQTGFDECPGLYQGCGLTEYQGDEEPRGRALESDEIAQWMRAIHRVQLISETALIVILRAVTTS